jgi:L-ascorbate 6-phosphate lactonase
MQAARTAGSIESVLAVARRARVGEREVALWNLGGAGFVVRAGRTTLLIDPFLGPSNPPDWVRAVEAPFSEDDVLDGPVHGLLMSHEHGDHADPVTLGAIARQAKERPGMPRTVVVGPPSCVEVAEAAGVREEQRRVLAHGESLQIGDTRVTALEMHDPSAKGCNGYLVEASGVSFLHCGDSLYFPGFTEIGAKYKVDALLVSVGYNPPGRFFYMDEADAGRAARDVGAHTLIPMHFNLWRATLLDPDRVARVAKWYVPGLKVVPAHYRRRITLTAAR